MCDPLIGRTIRQYEDRIEEISKRCKELERDGRNGEFNNYLRANTLDLMQKRSTDGGNGAHYLNSQLLSLIIAGIIVPVLKVDANGNFAISYEPTNPTITVAPMYTASNGLGSPDATKILEIFAETLRTNNEILVKAIKAKEKDDDIEIFERLLRSANLTSPPRATNTDADRFKQEKQGSGNDQAIMTRRKKESEKSSNEQEQEMKYRRDFSDQHQIDKIPSLNSGMVTNNELAISSEMLQGQGLTVQLPGSILNELRELIGHAVDSELTQSQQVITGKLGPHPQQQQRAYGDLTAQQAYSSASELMLEDQEFIKQIERMQNSQIMEKQRAISKKGIDS